jgi:hypothetical protein
MCIPNYSTPSGSGFHLTNVLLGHAQFEMSSLCVRACERARIPNNIYKRYLLSFLIVLFYLAVSRGFYL